MSPIPPPEEIRIRRAVPEDVDPIHRCLLVAFEPYRPRYTEGAFADTVPDSEGVRDRVQTMAVFVAVAADEIVGTISGHEESEGSGHIRGMAVLPRWHGRGVAAALLASVEEELRRRGCGRVNLHTTRPLERAAHFYEKNGYARTGRLEDFFGMDIIEFAKSL